MAKEHSFTSGQLFAVYDVFGQVPPESFAGMSKHLSLRAVFQFTDKEKGAINWSEETAPIGVADRVSFESNEPVTRKLTGGQRKYVAEVIQKSVTQKTPAYFERWLIPVLIEIGYPLQEDDWEEDDE